MTAGRVDQVSEPNVLRALTAGQKRLNSDDGSWPWVCVDDSSSNPCIPPTSNPAYTAFENGWTNVDGQAPVSFKRFLNWVHIRGAFTGGADNTVVFSLPELYRPSFPQAIVGSLSDGSGVWTCIIGTDGTVTYVTQGAL